MIVIKSLTLYNIIKYKTFNILKNINLALLVK